MLPVPHHPSQHNGTQIVYVSSPNFADAVLLATIVIFVVIVDL
jgi:hypothetical protein